MFRLARIFAKLRGGHGIDVTMFKTVARDLMPPRSDTPDELGKLLGDPAENEKGADRTVNRQHVKNFVGIGLNAARKRTPLTFVDTVGKSSNMEVIFNVKRDDVFHGPPLLL